MIDFLFISTIEPSDSSRRIQLDPLFHGLQQEGYNCRRINYKSEDIIEVEACKYVVLLYNDVPSLNISIKIKNDFNSRIICLASDIYNFDWYSQLAEFVDLFVAPTMQHKILLEQALWSKVAFVTESVDPISMDDSGNNSLPVFDSDNICWFGYPESFNKSFKYIFKTAFQLSGLKKDKFSIITKANEIVENGYDHIEFNIESFYKKTQEFSFSLLSHFPYDCHINTSIKSPNKLITSVVRGMIPLASNTVSYSDLLKYYGLGSLIFNSGDDLVELLKKLDVIKYTYDLKLVANDMISRFSPRSSAHSLLDQL